MTGSRQTWQVRDITVQVLCVDIVAVLDMITVMSWLQDTDTAQTQSAGLRTLRRKMVT